MLVWLDSVTAFFGDHFFVLQVCAVDYIIFVFCNILFTTHYRKYMARMAYENKIVGMKEIFNAYSSTWHALK